MKKDNKIATIVIIAAIVGILIGFGLSKVLSMLDSSKGSEGEPYTVKNLKEITKQVPSFEVRLLGDFEGIINDEFVTEDKIKMYEFDATISDAWGYTTNHYVGYRLKDLLDFYQITNFTSLTMTSLDNVSINYLYTDITDNMFLVFYRDGKLISENGRPMLLATDYAYRFSLEDLSEMYFNSSKFDGVDDDTEDKQDENDNKESTQE